MKKTIFILIAFISNFHMHSYAQDLILKIENFDIKQSLTNNSKIAIIATDLSDNASEKINGTYVFTINGFEKSLVFHDGVAVNADPIESSTFVYFKHKNQDKSIGHLYFLLKKENTITSVRINGLVLIAIPIVLLLLAYVFKRFITTLVVLLLIFAYFHYSKGLTFSHLMESIMDIFKSVL